ncbi:unnamed protein product [Gongylonema pulchrum]|uniref:Uncharacterized protein n=1 Tax=Gongylonema pulchrum TaxID=637853 RepID=A0A183E3X8_9BILA|nr:unnamed protein product [Gongylonema pulchrum]
MSGGGGSSANRFRVSSVSQSTSSNEQRQFRLDVQQPPGAPQTGVAFSAAGNHQHHASPLFSGLFWM